MANSPTIDWTSVKDTDDHPTDSYFGRNYVNKAGVRAQMRAFTASDTDDWRLRGGKVGKDHVVHYSYHDTDLLTAKQFKRGEWRVTPRTEPELAKASLHEWLQEQQVPMVSHFDAITDMRASGVCVGMIWGPGLATETAMVRLAFHGHTAEQNAQVVKNLLANVLNIKTTPSIDSSGWNIEFEYRLLKFCMARR